MLQNCNAIHRILGSFQSCELYYRFRTVAAAVSASFLTQSRFQLAGAFSGIPYLEAQGGVVSRRRMPRVSFIMYFRSSYCKHYVEFIQVIIEGVHFGLSILYPSSTSTYIFIFMNYFLQNVFLTDRFRLNFTLDQTRC